jgi:hypothetical protein
MHDLNENAFQYLCFATTNYFILLQKPALLISSRSEDFPGHICIEHVSVSCLKAI